MYHHEPEYVRGRVAACDRKAMRLAAKVEKDIEMAPPGPQLSSRQLSLVGSR
jgi:hypothetical protein